MLVGNKKASYKQLPEIEKETAWDLSTIWSLGEIRILHAGSGNGARLNCSCLKLIWVNRRIHKAFGSVLRLLHKRQSGWRGLPIALGVFSGWNSNICLQLYRSTSKVSDNSM